MLLTQFNANRSNLRRRKERDSAVRSLPDTAQRRLTGIGQRRVPGIDIRDCERDVMDGFATGLQRLKEKARANRLNEFQLDTMKVAPCDMYAYSPHPITRRRRPCCVEVLIQALNTAIDIFDNDSKVAEVAWLDGVVAQVPENIVTERLQI